MTGQDKRQNGNFGVADFVKELLDTKRCVSCEFGIFVHQLPEDGEKRALQKYAIPNFMKQILFSKLSSRVL